MRNRHEVRGWAWGLPIDEVLLEVAQGQRSR
jgi:hypothetical protein